DCGGDHHEHADDQPACDAPQPATAGEELARQASLRLRAGRSVPLRWTNRAHGSVNRPRDPPRTALVPRQTAAGQDAGRPSDRAGSERMRSISSIVRMTVTRAVRVVSRAITIMV